MFNDEDTASKILKESNPAQQKRLGSNVRNFNKNVWSKAMPNIMENGVFAKYDQNPELKKKLLSTKGKIIGEASPKDNVWGIGMSMHSKTALDNKTWTGSNLLGKILMKIRDNF